MKDNILSTICESKMFSHSGAVGVYNAKDLADIVFLMFLTLNILRNNLESNKFVRNYVSKTYKFKNFKKFHTNSTDIYFIMNVLFGEDDVKKYLKDNDASIDFINKLSIDNNTIRQWFNNIEHAKDDISLDRRFFTKLEKNLKISNSSYKSLRRLISDWNLLNNSQRQVAVTRLLFALKSNARKSELVSALEEIASIKNYIIDDAENPEIKKPTMSKVKKALIVGAATGGIASAYLGTKLYKSGKAINNYKTKTNETVAAGVVSAGNIASVPLPIGGVVSRKKKSKKTINNSI